MDNICVFPGTFDPFTLGHYDVAERAGKVFKKLIVAVNELSPKGCMFSPLERKEIASKSVKDIKNAEVVLFNDLLTDFCKRTGAGIVIRGLRTASDLEYENALSEAYKTQDNSIELLFFLNSQRYSHIRGTIVRDLIRYNGNIKGFIHENAYGQINTILRKH